MRLVSSLFGLFVGGLALACSSQNVTVVDGDGGSAGAAGAAAGGSGGTGATGGSAGAGGGSGGAGGSSGSGASAGAAGTGGAAGAGGCDCMPKLTTGWVPAAIAPAQGAACPAAYDGATYEGGEAAKDTGCACSCGALTGATCEAVLDLWNDTVDCTGLGPTETSFTSQCYSGTLKKGAKVRGKATKPGSCAPSAKLNAAAFDKPWTVCTVSALSDCATGTCSPSSPAPFQNQCIVSSTEKVCPSGYKKAFDLYTKLDDKRACGSGCGCATPNTTCTGVKANLCATNGSCPTNCNTTITPGVCTNVDGKAIQRIADGTPSGSCNPTGSAAVTGAVDVDPASQLLVCCVN